MSLVFAIHTNWRIGLGTWVTVGNSCGVFYGEGNSNVMFISGSFG